MGTVGASQMVRNTTELKPLEIFPEIQNALPAQSEFRRLLVGAAKEELPALLGKKAAERWAKKQTSMDYQYFVMGPSGSGDKLHAENGLPFYDVLIHGSRRWLLLKEDEMQRVAEKAREALEFDKTSAYMFFEEKLPELREEFGLSKFVEANQKPGDLVFVPSGWFRVSLSLADSISYYQTLLTDKNTLAAVVDNNVWRPQFRQYALAYCYDAKDLDSLPGIKSGSQLHNWLKSAIPKVQPEEATSGILNVLFQCGSVLVLQKDMPSLSGGKTACSEAVWTQCRKQLKAKLKERGVTASLDWLPEKAPTSLKDIERVAGGKEEL